MDTSPRVPSPTPPGRTPPGRAPSPPSVAVRATGLRKTYPARGRGTAPTVALDDLDLVVRRGTVHGLLGPNGAGKTTAVRALATLLRLDRGDAEVAGFDVRRDADEVRSRIGLTGQYAAVDEILTGRQNLVLFGRLFHLSPTAARRRADDLLERFSLADAGDRPLRTYSGGMRRRLDLAASLVLAPEVLFLDEPTTGLDPRSRGEVWDAIRGLVAAGTTVLLTTQYLDEADQLADTVSVIDHGRVIAEGTPDELKTQVGGDQLELTVATEADRDVAAALLERIGAAAPQVTGRRLVAPVRDRVASLAAAVRELDAAGIELDDLGLRRPTLDDVFLRLTGRPTAAAEATDRPTATSATSAPSAQEVDA